MNKEQALSILEQALNGANSKGVFNLQDSATVYAALTVVKEYLTLTTESIIMNKYSDGVENEVIKDTFKEYAENTEMITTNKPI